MSATDHSAATAIVEIGRSLLKGSGTFEPATAWCPLRAVTGVDTFATMPPTDLQAIPMDPDTPMPFLGDGQMPAELPFGRDRGPDPGHRCGTRRHAAVGGDPAPGRGAGQSHPEHGVLASLEAEFGLFASGPVMDAEMWTGVEAGVVTVQGVPRPWDVGMPT